MNGRLIFFLLLTLPRGPSIVRHIALLGRHASLSMTGQQPDIALGGRRASPSFEGGTPGYELQGRRPTPTLEGRVEE